MKAIIYYDPANCSKEICLSGNITDFFQGMEWWNMTIEGGNNSGLKKQNGEEFFDCVAADLSDETIQVIQKFGFKSILIKRRDGTEWIAFDNSLGYRVQLGDFL